MFQFLKFFKFLNRIWFFPSKLKASFTTFLTNLFFFWNFQVILITKKEKITSMHQISIPPSLAKSYLILDRPTKDQISLVVEGALLPHYYANLSARWMNVWVEMFETRVALELSTPLRENHIKHSTVNTLDNNKNILCNSFPVNFSILKSPPLFSPICFRMLATFGLSLWFPKN